MMECCLLWSWHRWFQLLWRPDGLITFHQLCGKPELPQGFKCFLCDWPKSRQQRKAWDALFQVFLLPWSQQDTHGFCWSDQKFQFWRHLEVFQGSLLFVRNTFRYCEWAAIIATKNVRFHANFQIKCSQLFQDWLHSGSQATRTSKFTEIQPVSTISRSSGKDCPHAWLPFNGAADTSFRTQVQ